MSTEEALSCSAIPLGLEKYINHFAVLVYGPPKIMLLAIDLHEDLIDVERITITTVFSVQSACINGSKLDTPETDRFSGYSDTSLGQ